MRPQGPGNIITVNGVAESVDYDKMQRYLSWEAFSTGRGSAGSGQGLLAPGLPTGRVLWPVGNPQTHGVNFWRSDAMLAKKLGDQLFAMEDRDTPAPVDSFKPLKIGPDVQFARSIPPDGSICVVVRGTRPGDKSNHVAFVVDGSASELVADWRGNDAPDLSSVVRDVDGDNVDTTRFWASLESLMKVVETVNAPFGMEQGAQIALNFAGCPAPSQNAAGRVGWGAAHFETPARKFGQEPSKNPVTGSGAEPQTVETEEVGPAFPITALMSSEAGGPISSLAIGTRMQIGTSAEGVPIHSAGLFCDAIFTFESPNYEGPLHFERDEYTNPPAAPFTARAHIRFDEGEDFNWRGLRQERNGKWKVEAESLFKREEYTDVVTGEKLTIIRNNNIELQYPSWWGTPEPLPTSGNGGGPGDGPDDGPGDGPDEGIGDIANPNDFIGEDDGYVGFGGESLTIFDKTPEAREEERIRRAIRGADRDNGRNEPPKAANNPVDPKFEKRKAEIEAERERKKAEREKKKRDPYGGQREDENAAEYDKRKQRNKNFAGGLAGLSRGRRQRKGRDGDLYTVENNELLLPQTSHVKALGQLASDKQSYVYTRDPVLNTDGSVVTRATGPGILAFGPPELTTQRTFAVTNETPISDLSAFQVMLYGDTKLGFGCTDDTASAIVSGTTIGKRSDNGLEFTTVDDEADEKQHSATTFNNATGSQIKMRKQSIDGAYVPTGYIAEEAYYLNDGVFLNDGIVLSIGYPGCCS